MACHFLFATFLCINILSLTVHFNYCGFGVDFAARFKLFNACVQHWAQWDLIPSWGPSLTMQYTYYISTFFCLIFASFKRGFVVISQFLFDILILQWFSDYLKQIWGTRFQCFANHPLRNIRNKSLHIWTGGWFLACLYTQYMLMYLKGKMCDLLQIFSFANHRIEELESACLLSHAEVVPVITVCYVFKKAVRRTFLLLCVPHRAGKVRHHLKWLLCRRFLECLALHVQLWHFVIKNWNRAQTLKYAVRPLELL